MQLVGIDSELSVLRLSVEQYHAMRDAGILGEDARVELIEGLIVPKMTKNPPDRISTDSVRRELERVLPAGWSVQVQDPITTGDSEPEPDVAVIRGSARDYPDRHPGPAEVALVVEVADESLERDRGPKQRAYARAGIVAYWIVNLRERTVLAFQEPGEHAYGRLVEYPAGSEIPVGIAGREFARIRVDALLP